MRNSAGLADDEGLGFAGAKRGVSGYSDKAVDGFST